MADVAPTGDPPLRRDLAGLFTTGTVYIVACHLTAPGNDGFDSPLWKWGWLVLPLVAALAGAIRSTPSAAYSGALIGPQALYTVLFGAVLHDPDEGASFWMVALLFIGILFVIAGSAQMLGYGLVRRTGASTSVRVGLAIGTGVVLTAAAIDVTGDVSDRLGTASQCDAAWDQAVGEERLRPGYPEHYAPTFTECDSEGWRRNTLEHGGVIDLGGPGFVWYCANYVRGDTCAGLGINRNAGPTLGTVESVTCAQFVQAPPEEQDVVAAALESRASQAQVTAREAGPAVVSIRNECENRGTEVASTLLMDLWGRPRGTTTIPSPASG